MSANTRTICPGWPKGPCGIEAGTPWTNLYCERCDEKRRAHIEAAVEKNILEPTVVDAPVVVQPKEFSEVDWNMYLGRKSDQEDFGDCAIGPPRAALNDWWNLGREDDGLIKLPEIVNLSSTTLLSLLCDMQGWFKIHNRLPYAFALCDTAWFAVQEQVCAWSGHGPLADGRVGYLHFLLQGVPIVLQNCG